MKQRPVEEGEDAGVGGGGRSNCGEPDGGAPLPDAKRVCREGSAEQDEEEDEEEEDMPGITCGICLGTQSTQAVIGHWIGGPRVPGCGHEFCWECLRTWAAQCSKCPMCRSEFSRITRVDLRTGRRGPTQRVKTRGFDYESDDDDDDASAGDEAGTQDGAGPSLPGWDEEWAVCRACGACDNRPQLLACALCATLQHTYCTQPPLPDAPPPDRFYCGDCVDAAKAHSATELVQAAPPSPPQAAAKKKRGQEVRRALMEAFRARCPAACLQQLSTARRKEAYIGISRCGFEHKDVLSLLVWLRQGKFAAGGGAAGSAGDELLLRCASSSLTASDAGGGDDCAAAPAPATRVAEALQKADALSGSHKAFLSAVSSLLRSGLCSTARIAPCALRAAVLDTMQTLVDVGGTAAAQDSVRRLLDRHSPPPQALLPPLPQPQPPPPPSRREWCCPQCTLLNTEADAACAACGGPAPAMAARRCPVCDVAFAASMRQAEMDAHVNAHF